MVQIKDIPLRDLKDWSSRIKSKLDERMAEADNREYFLDFYEMLTDVQNGIEERTESIQFLKDVLHNKNFFNDDGFSINLGNQKAYKYLSLRKQLYLSLFAIIGGVYDSSARLCFYALDNRTNKEDHAYIHNIFFKSENITKGYQDILGPLKRDFGYFLGVLVYLRNLFIHRGESCLGGEQLFQSSACNGLDSLNGKALTKIEDGADGYYGVTKYSKNNKELQLSMFKNKQLIELVETYLLYSDHAIGFLINSLLGKHLGAV